MAYCIIVFVKTLNVVTSVPKPENRVINTGKLDENTFRCEVVRDELTTAMVEKTFIDKKN